MIFISFEKAHAAFY